MLTIALLIAAAYALLSLFLLALCRAAAHGDRATSEATARQLARRQQLEATEVYRRAIRRDVSVAVAVYHGAVPAQRVGA